MKRQREKKIERHTQHSGKERKTERWKERRQRERDAKTEID